MPLHRTILLGAVLALAACQSVNTTQPGVVGVSRTQSMLVSSKQINDSAQKAYAQTIQQAAQKGLLNRDPSAVARVRAVAARLIPQTAAFRPDAPGWRWEVNVISSSQVNAWCMPGGKIAVYTGILDGLRLTDDELAAVMGHEIAHALREHGRERGFLPVALAESEVDRLFYEAASFPGFRLVVDLDKQTVSTENGSLSFRFEIDGFRKYCLLNGLDEIGLTLRHADKIRAFEAMRTQQFPWFFR